MSKSRLNKFVGLQGSTSLDQPPSDLEPSDLPSAELPETQLMRVGTFPKEGSPVKPSGWDDSGDTPRQGVLGGPGAFLCSAPGALAATIQRQFGGEFHVSFPTSHQLTKCQAWSVGRQGAGPATCLEPHLGGSHLRRRNLYVTISQKLPFGENPRLISRRISSISHLLSSLWLSGVRES